MQQPEYKPLREYLKDGNLFVLDSGAFNRDGKDPSVIDRLRHAASGAKVDLLALDRMVIQEAHYLDNLAWDISSTRSSHVLPGVVKELNVYYKAITNVAMDLRKRGVNIPSLSFFRSSCADAICASYNFGEHNAMRALDGRCDMYRKYVSGITEIMRQTRTEEEEMSGTDVRTLALALICAHEEPTNLFTTDIRHIARAAKLVYDYPEGARTLPRRPTNKFCVYGGFEQGWALRVEDGKRIRQ